MNQTENQLRSWQPRRASAGLKRRIFDAPDHAHRLAARSLRWLAPAAACLLLAMTVLHQGNFAGDLPHPEPVLMVNSSNQSYVMNLSGTYAPRENEVSPVTFDWTNRGSSTSSVSFTPSRKSVN